MIKRPVRRGDNAVFLAIVDSDGSEIAVCTSEEIRIEIINALNAESHGETQLPRGPDKANELPRGQG